MTTYSEAVANCTLDGGTLAVFNTQEKVDGLLSGLNVTGWYWAGLTGTAPCYGSECSGLLTWADQSLFNWADATYDYLWSRGGGCFRVEPKGRESFLFRW